MRFYFILFTIFSFSFCLCAQESGTSNTPENDFSELLNSSFFGDALDNANADQDALGTQRIIDTEDSIFSPSLSFSSSYNYTSNPIKAEKSSPNYMDDGFTTNFNLSFLVGVGEYSLGDNILLTPSLSLTQMRTYTDPVRDRGDEMKAFDVDVQILGFAVPLILPEDFTLSIGHTYVRPIAFREDNVINYTNTPSLNLSKNIPLSNGDIITMNVGISYSFSESDTLEEQIADPAYYNFIKAVMNSNGLDPLTSQPTNLQDSWAQMVNVSYIKPISEDVTLATSYNLSRSQYTEGANTGRQDYLHNLGINLSYAFNEWANFSLLSNYSWKLSDDPSVPEYEDFIGGLVAGFNYSF